MGTHPNWAKGSLSCRRSRRLEPPRDRLGDGIAPPDRARPGGAGHGRGAAPACRRRSRGSVSDAYDNALCESFFATLECELLHRQYFSTQADARLAVFDFIEGWYNPRRRHSALDYRSPMIFERTHAIDDRTMPAGATIDQGGAISLSPSEALR